MKKIICLTGVCILATGIYAQEIPSMREEISSQIYIPSAQEQQNLTDAEYSAYRRAGLISGARKTTGGTSKRRGATQQKTTETTDQKAPAPRARKTAAEQKKAASNPPAEQQKK